MSASVYTSKASHYRRVLDELSLPATRVLVGTYGVGLGFEKVGRDLLPCPATRALRAMQTMREKRVLVGIPPGDQSALYETIGGYPVIEWRGLRDSHLKCWCFVRSRSTLAIVGGRNLGCSSFADISVVLEGKAAKEVVRFFDSQWERAIAL